MMELKKRVPRVRTTKKTVSKRSVHEGKVMFLTVLPFLILVFLFAYFPLHGWIYSLYDYKPALGLAGSEFVGLKWFKMLVNSKTQVDQIIQVLKTPSP